MCDPISCVRNVMRTCLGPPTVLFSDFPSE